MKGRQFYNILWAQELKKASSSLGNVTPAKENRDFNDFMGVEVVVGWMLGWESLIHLSGKPEPEFLDSPAIGDGAGRF